MMKRSNYAVMLMALALVSTASYAGWPEGVAAFQKGDLTQAANEFKSVVDAQPEWPGGHYMLGWTYLRAKRNQEAITHLRKAYDLDKSNADYQLRLGEAYINAQRYADGVAVLSKIDAAALSDPKARPHLTKLKAVAYSKTGQTTAAIAEFKRAAEAEPNNAELWYQYGALAFNDGSNDVAVSALTKAAQLAPRDAAKQRSLAQALLKKGRTTRSGKETIYKQAAAAAQKLVAADASADNLILHGECQLGAKDYDGAIASFEKAAAKAGSWLPHFYIGQAYTAKAQYRSAESSLKTALDNTSAAADETRVWKQLAFVYEKQKNFNGAIEAYTRAGDSGGAERARENKRIADENLSIEEENRRLAQMEEEKKRLEEELKKLPGGPPPRR